MPARRRWTEDRVRAELVALFGSGGAFEGEQEWPTAKEFAAVGQRMLYRVATEPKWDFGGSGRWMRELGLTERAGYLLLSESAALERARAMVQREGHLPCAGRLRAKGEPRLARYLEKNGGAKKFGDAHGLPTGGYVAGPGRPRSRRP